MNVQDECIKIHSKFGMSEMANYKIQLLFDSEIEKVKKEYEEKLRWIPVEEKLPERDKNVLIKRSAPFHKYELTAFNRDGIFYSNETGEILSKVTHWRSFL